MRKPFQVVVDQRPQTSISGLACPNHSQPHVSRKDEGGRMRDETSHQRALFSFPLHLSSLILHPFLLARQLLVKIFAADPEDPRCFCFVSFGGRENFSHIFSLNSRERLWLRSTSLQAYGDANRFR